jgi:hypothetical protein
MQEKLESVFIGAVFKITSNYIANYLVKICQINKWPFRKYYFIFLDPEMYPLSDDTVPDPI